MGRAYEKKNTLSLPVLFQKKTATFVIYLFQ
jgi:hypothetical protein